MKTINKRLRLLAVAGLISLIAIQFIPVELNDQGYDSVIAFENETQVSPELAAVLQRPLLHY